MRSFSKFSCYPRSMTFAALLAIASVVSFAKESSLNYLTDGQTEASAILAPPPLLNSSEQAADLDEVRLVYRGASAKEMAEAHEERKFSVFNFTNAVGPFLVETNLPKTAAFFDKVLMDAQTVTSVGKNYFQRPRPYTTDPSLANGKLETSFSYPSGHSTESMVLALVLADLFPEKRSSILAQARTMGWHRVQIARHYPTDIYAGRVLAQAIMRDLRKSEVFKKDLAGVRAEIRARAEPVPTTARN